MVVLHGFGGFVGLIVLGCLGFDWVGYMFITVAVI